MTADAQRDYYLLFGDVSGVWHAGYWEGKDGETLDAWCEPINTLNDGHDHWDMPLDQVRAAAVAQFGQEWAEAEVEWNDDEIGG
jgi:hypothetical protein